MDNKAIMDMDNKAIMDMEIRVMEVKDMEARDMVIQDMVIRDIKVASTAKLYNIIKSIIIFNSGKKSL